MPRYILRRLLQMIPTVFGVILITFVLFNVAGGSPATMTLGKHVSPKSLEDFDEQRGFNKPLFFGWWTRTRAYEDSRFDRTPGPWSAVAGATHVTAAKGTPGHLILATNGFAAVPLAFPLRADTEYALRVKCRLSDGGSGALHVRRGGSIVSTGALKSGAWQTRTIRFKTDSKPEDTQAGLFLSSGVLEVSSVRLRRGTEGFFDSQLWFYLRQLARFDFGVSSSTNQKVTSMMRAGVGPSLCLTVPIFLAELLITISISLLCAFYRDRLLDRTIVVVSVALMSVNYIVWIVAGQYVLANQLGWFPVWGFESWRYLLLPVLIGTVSGLGGGVRFYRTVMLDEMYKEYVRTAFAKGVSQRGVLFKHVLKNALIPIITNVVIQIPFLYTGSLLLESFYGIPGLGYLGVNALNSSDVDVVRALVLVGSLTFVVANLVSDLCYAWADPRVRLR